jgi:Polyketide cyclase / dehydrase and lipid transport
MYRKAAFACVMTLIAGPAGAAEVSRNVTVDASAADVWQWIGPYCAIADWYPGIDRCTEEEMNGAGFRHLVTADGSDFLEKKLSYDDAAMSYTYAIVEGVLPVQNYQSVFSVEAMGDKAVVTWSATFDPKGATEDEAQKTMIGVFDAGLDAVKAHFAQ